MLVFPRQHILESVTLGGQKPQVDLEFLGIQMVGEVAAASASAATPS